MAEPLILSEKRDISKWIYYFGLNQARQLAEFFWSEKDYLLKF